MQNNKNSSEKLTDSINLIDTTSGKKVNWDQLLEIIHKEFITIKDVEYKKSKDIFTVVLDEMKKKMQEQCKFFQINSKQVLYAGSVYDGIKVPKLNEFDMDIVINLPVNYKNDDIILETVEDQPGFVKIKIGTAFDVLDKLPHWEKRNKVTRDWRDSDKYLLQNKFRSWIHRIVQKALNQLNWRVTVNGETYSLAYKESGPAFALKLNVKGAKQFNLDVNLVPVIRFQYPRWPEGYRQIEGSSAEDWLVVPKPNKVISDNNMKNRYWRLSFQEFERDMMKNSYQLKSTIRLMKKLRDSLQLNIASYYITTLFLWKIMEKENTVYWKQGLGVLFRDMVEEFYKALENKEIRYFWQVQNNLISHIKPEDLEAYTEKLKGVMDAIDRNDVVTVVSSLLYADELERYHSKLSHSAQLSTTKPNTATKPASSQEPVASTSTASQNDENENAKKIMTDDNSKAVIVSDGKTNVFDDNVKNLKQLKQKIEHKLRAIITEKNSIDSSQSTEMAFGDKSDAVIEILFDLQQNIDKLSATKHDQTAIKKLINKMNMLIDKTEDHSEMLTRLEMTESEYKQKFDELNKTITELTDDKESLQREIKEAEVRAERKGTFKSFVYSALMMWASSGGSLSSLSGTNDGTSTALSVRQVSTPMHQVSMQRTNYRYPIMTSLPSYVQPPISSEVQNIMNTDSPGRIYLDYEVNLKDWGFMPSTSSQDDQPPPASDL